MLRRGLTNIRLLFFFAVLTATLGFLSCSQTKDTLFNRTCHNLSAHYNGYYNSGLKLQDGMDKLEDSEPDKYDRILPIFKYGTPEKAKTVFPQMEDAMKRTTTVIQRHTIYDKSGNEKPLSERWIDDNWLLYGKCLFIKHEYFPAIEAFHYVEVTYKRESSRFLATLWLAKTNLQLTQLNEAEERLERLRNEKAFPKKNKWELEATMADFYLQTKNYPKTIEHLVKAIPQTPRREDKIRFRFILAQLYQAQGEHKLAFDLYTKVIKMNPKYEMGFNARINRARCADSGNESTVEVRKELLRMEKDPKNKEYLDQVYYALAGLEKLQGHKDEEIDYLNKSVRASSSNQNQKAISYLALAEIAFEKPNYMLAHTYYDSTISVLGTDYPGYTEILARRNSLTRLAKYLTTIATEDSLQKLSKLSPEEQKKLLSDIIRAQMEERQREKEKNQENQLFNSGTGQSEQRNQATGGSGWYFYNPQAISFGFNEFTRKWGTRKLEDNWRRSNKESTAPAVEVEKEEGSEVTVADTTAKDNGEKRLKEMMGKIPVTTEAMEKSTNKIVEAYYNAAMIYKEQIGDKKEAIHYFEELLQRYPKCKYEIQCEYQLYRMYAELGESEKSDHYKNIILNDHGDTEYAEIIRNPEHAKDIASRKSNLEVFYEETYRKYENGEYANVIQRKSQADLMFPQNPLTPKFDLLRSLSIGRTQAMPQFEASLKDIVRTYADDPVKEQAQAILDYIHGGGNKAIAPGAEPPAQDTAANKKLYTYMPDTVHFVAIIFQNIGGPLDGNKLRNRLSDFNTKYYGSKNYQVSDLMLDHRLKLVLIKSFDNKADALAYNSLLYDNDEVYGNLDPDSYQEFVISANNLAALVREKKTSDYDTFYRTFYR